MTPPELDSLLADLAERHDLTVLAARDLGSRAWNLASESSDYDVAILFRQPAAAYATVGGSTASVSESRGAAEVRGWNVSRFGELLVESNPAALEFLHSPLRYREHDALAALEADVADRFRPIGLYHHYRSLAAGQYRTYLQQRLLVHGDPAFVVVDETPTEWVVEPLDEEEADAKEATTGETNAKEPGADEADEASEATGTSAPGRLPKDDERYESGAVDGTVKRNLYVIRAVLYAEFVRDTHEFPTLDFPAFVAAERERIGDAYDDVRTLVERKRAGEGDAVVGDVFGAERVVLPDHLDPAVHAVRGIPTGRVNAFVRETFEQ